MKEDEWKTGRKWAYTRINPFVFNCIICSFKLSLRNANHSKRKREKKYPWSREQRESKNLQSFVQRNEILRGAEIEHSLKQSGWFSVSNFIVRPFTGCSSFESCPSDLIRLFVSKWVRERARARERESPLEVIILRSWKLEGKGKSSSRYFVWLSFIFETQVRRIGWEILRKRRVTSVNLQRKREKGKKDEAAKKLGIFILNEWKYTCSLGVSYQLLSRNGKETCSILIDVLQDLYPRDVKCSIFHIEDTAESTYTRRCEAYAFIRFRLGKTSLCCCSGARSFGINWNFGKIIRWNSSGRKKDEKFSNKETRRRYSIDGKRAKGGGVGWGWPKRTAHTLPSKMLILCKHVGFEFPVGISLKNFLNNSIRNDRFSCFAAGGGGPKRERERKKAHGAARLEKETRRAPEARRI